MQKILREVVKWLPSVPLPAVDLRCPTRPRAGVVPRRHVATRRTAAGCTARVPQATCGHDGADVIVAGLLLAYAGAIGTMGPHLLRRAQWPHRSPRLGVLAWQAASFSLVGAVLLAGMVLVLSTTPAIAALADWARACLDLLQSGYAVPGGRTGGLLIGLVLLALVGRVVVLLGRDLWVASRGRIRHRRVLALIGRFDQTLNAVVLDHDVVAAYCVPGRGGRVVFTSAALGSLGAQERQAVLVHELAHLRQRHHLVLVAAHALRHGLPFVPLLRAADAHITVLVEMIADDVSARRCDRMAVASALQSLDGGLSGGTSASDENPRTSRLHRLLVPVRPPRLLTMAVRAIAVVGVLTVPVVIAAAPAVGAVRAELCPVADHAPVTDTSR